jgi:hypothetical protein
MRAIKILILVLVSIAIVGLINQTAEAASKTPVPGSGSGHGHYGHGGHYGGYYGHGHYGHYYYPYRYYPYAYGYPYWGFGFGYGYPAYGYGYGFYPYSGTYYYQGYGEIRTQVKPDEAQVYLDGDYVGVADDFNSWYQRMNVEPGRHRLVFRLQGFQPYVLTLRVLPGENYNVKHDMIPGDDALPESEMRLPPEQRDDRYERDYRDRDYDRNRDYDRRPDYDDDDYDRNGSNGNQYQYGSNGYSGTDGRSSRDDQYDRRKQATPSPAPGMEQPGAEFEIQDQGQPAGNKSMVTIQVEPKDSTIYVDGTYYGTGDAQNSNQIQVLLSQGTHRLEVVRPGYQTFSKDFEVNESATRNITIQLDKK